MFTLNISWASTSMFALIFQDYVNGDANANLNVDGNANGSVNIPLPLMYDVVIAPFNELIVRHCGLSITSQLPINTMGSTELNMAMIGHMTGWKRNTLRFSSFTLWSLTLLSGSSVTCIQLRPHLP